jgi:hypothetical protein
MILWAWWMEIWAMWFAMVDVIVAPETPPPPTKPNNVVDLKRWRHDHPSDRPRPTDGRAA